MGYLLILALLATLKVFVQGRLCRGHVHSLRDLLLLNGCIFTSVSFILFCLFARAWPSPALVVYSLASGIFNMLFQLFYILAMKKGAVSLTVTVNQFNFVVPLFVGLLFLNEFLTRYSVFGLLLFSVALLLITRPNPSGQGCSRAWLVYTLLACLFSGGVNSVSVLFSRSEWAGEKNLFILCAHVISAALSFIIGLCMPKEKGAGFKVKLPWLVGILVIGLALGGYHSLTLTALGKGVNSGVFYSALNVLILIMTTAVDLIWMKEKLSKSQLFGILIGVAAVVVINL